MTEQQAIRMALEALESALSDDKPYIDKSKEAIDALRQALERANEPELKMGIDYTLTQTNVGIGERAAEAYEAAKQRGWSGVSDERLMKMPDEPVAICEYCEKERPVIHAPQPADEPFGYFQYSIRLDAWVQNRDSNKGAAFYTRPQPAAWVGLTPEDYDSMRPRVPYIVNDFTFADVAAIVEAKLKDKNT